MSDFTRDLNKKLKEYRDVERQIEAAIQEKRIELARILAAKNKLKTRATYAPTAATLDYYATNCLRIAQQPAPIHGGPSGLRMAAAEAEAHDARKGSNG
jgi:hypothetical protein